MQELFYYGNNQEGEAVKEILDQVVKTETGLVTMPVQYEDPPENASFEVARSYVEGLPPEEFRLRPITEKIETPTDAWGVVDTDQLIRTVMGTVSPEYRWTGKSDIHHGQWCRADYVNKQHDVPESRALAFRELAPNKIQLPRVFHNWIHAITLPPAMPSPEVMHESVREWVILQDFFRSVQEAAQVERLYTRDRSRREANGQTYSEEQEEIIDEERRRRMEGVYTHFGALQTVPIERWPFSGDIKLPVAAGRIGSLVLSGFHRRSMHIRRPDILRLPAAA
jgi:hypothetical protein